MPIEYRKNQVQFRDIATVEEAEQLLGWLQNRKSPRIDLSQCTHMHPANLQVLMAAKAKITTWPADEGLRAWLQSALSA